MTSDKDFLGTGWSFPPTFSRASLSVLMVKDNQDIHQSLYILFSTRLGLARHRTQGGATAGVPLSERGSPAGEPSWPA